MLVSIYIDTPATFSATSERCLCLAMKTLVVVAGDILAISYRPYVSHLLSSDWWVSHLMLFLASSCLISHQHWQSCSQGCSSDLSTEYLLRSFTCRPQLQSVYLDSLLLLYLQKVGDQLYGILMDFLPRMRRIHEGGVLYLFVDVLVLIEGEGS